MKSVIRTFGSELPPIVYPIRNDGEVDVCPVDAFAGATFNMNEFGHIKSDVSVLMEAQSQSEIDLISKRLVEAQGENPDLSELTDSDIFRYSMSRYYQTPAEVEMFGERLAKAQYDRQQRLANEAAKIAKYEAEQKAMAIRKANIEQAIKDGKITSDGKIVDTPVKV